MNETISYVPTANMSHDEWVNRRKHSIGGSDAAAVIGLNAYVSPYALWSEKTGKTPGFDGNLATEVGAFLEEFVAKKFEKETGKKVKRRNAFIYNSKYPWAHANVDRVIVGEDALLEIKTCDSLSMKKFKNGEYPAHYYAQMVHYLAVTEKSRCYLAVLIGNKQFKWFTVERDEAEISALMMAEENFWYQVQNDLPPEIDGMDSTIDALNETFPISDPEADAVDLTGCAVDLALLDECTQQIKALEEKKKAAQARVMEILGAAEKGFYAGYSVSRKSQKRSTFDRKKWEKEHGAIPEEYFKVSDNRTFRFKKENEE